MSNQRYDIVFRGEIIPGQPVDKVKQRMAALFKIDAVKVEAMFAAASVALKKNVDQATAEKYRAAIGKAGAEVDLVPSGGQAPAQNSTVTPAPATAEPAAKPSAEKPKKLSLKERLEMLEAEEKAKAEQLQREQPSEQSAFSLLPLEADEPAEPQVPQGKADFTKALDEPAIVSTFSVKPMEGDLLEPEEKARPVVSDLDPDFDVSPVGAEMLKPEERRQTPVVAVDTDHLDMDALGVDVLKPEERRQIPEVTVATDHLDLAPVGSDMGQKKAAVVPVVPDTSDLSLEDP